MTRAIIWKELREQALIGLTLIVFGSGILVAAATFAEPPGQNATPSDVVRFLGAGLLATMMLAVTAGTVCGGALFAAEREAGTIGFLESLPVSRWRIWRAKLAAGSLLAVAQIGFVLLVAIALGLVETLGWAFAITVFSLLAFSWGAYGSTRAQTTLGSVGIAVSGSTLAFILYFIPLWFLFPTRNAFVLQPVGGWIFLTLMFGTPLLASALRYTRTDRMQRAADATPIRLRGAEPASGTDEIVEPRRRPQIGAKAMLWLAWRQLAKPGLVIAAFAVVLGCSLLPENVHPILLCPGMALTAGVLAGVTMFMDEQGGAARFWGERRLPVLRFWFAKLLVHLGFAAGLLTLILLPGFIQSQSGDAALRGGSTLAGALRSLLFDGSHLGSQGWRLLTVPLAYGFVAGHLCGLLFKKTVVAAGVAGVVGGSMAAFWMPSLLSGGTLGWQLWLPPAVALATAGLLMRAWSSERLPTRRPMRTLVSGLACAIAALAGGLGWRVLGVPDAPGGEDDIAYIASLPPLDAMDSGRQFRTAAERFVRYAQSVPPFPKQPGPPRASLEERLANTVYFGWNADDSEAKEWIDNVYALDSVVGDPDERWFVQARNAGREPVDGIFEHPLRTGTTASLQTQVNGRRMGVILLARGLKQQAEGDATAFPEELRTALALGRTFRNGSLTVPLGYGNDVGRAACAATDRWLEAYAGPPSTLRVALDVLLAEDAAPPFDPSPHLLAERYVMRELAKAPGQFLPAQITPPGKDREHYNAIVDLVATAWNVPWERERTRRLSGLGFETGEVDADTRALIRGRPGSSLFLARKVTPREMIESDRQLRLHRRAAILLLAIRIHQSERGAFPGSLDDLVRGGILRAIPLDPFSDAPFRYRISPGETLPAPAQVLTTAGAKTLAGSEPRPIPAGQPVLWSAGPDGADDGGRTLPSRPGMMRAGPDIVYLPGAK